MLTNDCDLVSADKIWTILQNIMSVLKEETDNYLK